MRSISPVIAIIILILMTVGAGGMAFMTLNNYQEQVKEASEKGTEYVAELGRTQLKIEQVSEGKVYLRNMGTEPIKKAVLLIEGRPVEFEGPDDCQPGKVCVFEITEEPPDCGDDECQIQIETETGSVQTNVDEDDALPGYSPRYYNFTINATNMNYGEDFFANVTWDSEISRCVLEDGCYGFTNQTITTQKITVKEWMTWE